MQSNNIEDHRNMWAEVAKKNGWGDKPIYLQVWRDNEGNITDSVSFRTLTKDVFIDVCQHDNYDDYFDRCPDCDLEGVIETIEAEQALLDADMNI